MVKQKLFIMNKQTKKSIFYDYFAFLKSKKTDIFCLIERKNERKIQNQKISKSLNPYEQIISVME